MKNPELRSITSLKGLLILVIVLHNSLSIYPLFDYIPGTSFIRNFGGTLGDAVFYMISGFLFDHSYRERISCKEISFPAFIYRRLSKLYPLYFITNLIALFIATINYGLSIINLEKIIFTFLIQTGTFCNYVPYNSPTWFIAPLFVCYTIFFVVNYHFKKTPLYNYAILFIVGYILQTAKLEIPFCYAGNGMAMCNFFLGCLCNQIFASVNTKYRPWIYFTCIASIIIAFSGFLTLGVHIFAGNFDTVCFFLLAPAILYLSVAEGFIKKILEKKKLVFLGKISMSIFFWHMVVYSFLEIILPTGVNRELYYILYIIILFLWSFLSYLLIENKSTELNKYRKCK